MQAPGPSTPFELPTCVLEFPSTASGTMGEADIQRGLDAEWLLTTGNGGFAMGNALGVNRRRYHGLLIGSVTPPVDRWNMLNMLAEHVVVDPDGPGETRADLFTLRGGDGSLSPRGFDRLARFELLPDRCAWTWRIGAATITRTLRMGHQRNTATVSYSARGGRVRLVVRPYVTIRDFHALLDPSDERRYRVQVSGCALRVKAQERELVVRARARGAGAPQPIIVEDRAWKWNVRYDIEAQRGQSDNEHLFSPGWVTTELSGAGTDAESPVELVIALAMSPDQPDDDARAHERGTHRARVLQRAIATSPALRAHTPLVCAADDFLVRREVGGKPLTTVLAGYPWFADWGRDAMISIPGLLLATGRIEEARQALAAFAAHERDGLIPNRFDDLGGEPEYNTVDAPLWFLHACAEYLRAANDRAAFERELLPACRRIINAFRVGTRNQTFMDPGDGLIASGDHTTQLTWMDAKRDGTVFTPRHGKAVEINALWHHGLCVVSEALRGSDPGAAAELRALAEKVAQSFRAAFVRPDGRGLFDVLHPGERGQWHAVDHVRPNQLFAVSLEHSPLDEAQRRAVLNTVRDELLTPMGLRTLSPRDPGYAARFEGSMWQRDAAYHNGTVWPWLIGPYAEAVLRVGGFSASAKREARAAIQPLLDEMVKGPIGNLCEVYDGDEPRRPQGCTAQAWSVGEVLRVAAMVG